MIQKVIYMGGAGFLATHVQSFNSREDWIANRVKYSAAFLDQKPETRAEMFGQIWDIACPDKPITESKKKK